MIGIISDIQVGTAAPSTPLRTGLGCPAEPSSADVRGPGDDLCEGKPALSEVEGMPSRQPAGRRRYTLFAALLGLLACVQQAPAESFNAARAMQYTREVVAFGARPIGSANHKKLENYILNHLKRDSVDEDAFTATTPEGQFPVRNLIAKFPGTRDGVIVIAGHYDTNYPLRNTGYVGANDGGSSTAVLLELANQLRGKKREGYSVWLVWTDGEEAVKTWTATDSLYGTRHLAEKWQQDGTLKNIKAFLLADMIGDADLNVERDSDSTPWLEDLVYQAASKLGYQSHFFERTIPVADDHLPFVERGVPCADLIDLDYGYGNVFHHTPQDTLDKLSPKSIEIVGTVILETVRLLDKR
jgi:Zn-dependent M28 family amino/carboxypeptidase